MRKKLHTLLALSLLSAATLSVSCNKDKEDPSSNGGSGTGATTNIISPNAPKDNDILYYYDENAGTLYKRAGKSNWTVIGSLVGFKKGNTVYSGKRAPERSDKGEEKDYFINSTNDKVYQKINGNWQEIDIEGEIVIKDPNFKATLLTTGNNRGSVDTNGNGKISASEAKAVQALRVSSADISSLDGIEHFTNVTVLEAKGNKLKTVYLDKLVALKQLDLTGNQLEGTVDLSKLPNLQNGKVNIVGGGNNPQVEKIIVSDVHKATALNTSEHTNKYTATGEVDQYIEFDPVVKTAIIGMGNTGPDKNSDGGISISEALAYTGRIDIELAGVQSLKGLEKFENISALRIFPGKDKTNTLTNGKLSLTNFPNLETLDITNTTLEELEVKSSLKLTRISIVNGNLKNITITEATALKELSLERNNLTALPATFFDGLTELTAINLMGNNIVGELNLTSIKGLETNAGKVQIMRVCGTCNPKDRTNKRVTKIYVKDEAVNALNDAEGTSVYVSISGGRPQDNTVVNVPNENLRRLIFRKLKAIDGTTYLNRTYKDPFTQSDVDKITDLIGEDYSISNDVTDLTGLERFTKLKKLDLFPQGATTLDLTGMSELEEITLGGTMATITGEGTSLEKVTIKENYNVKKLDLRGFANLKRIIISENSQAPNHIECIAVPEDKVKIIKAGITFSAGGGNADSAAQKQALYRDKVQSTPCN